MRDNKNYKLSMRSSDKDDDEDEDGSSKDFLSYATLTKSLQCLRVFFDEPIQGSKYYRMLIEHISQLSNEDVVQFMFDTYGGSMDGALAIITAIQSTNATVEAVISGNCMSAGSLIALSCDTVEVLPHATMMIHCASFGSTGKDPDVQAMVNFNVEKRKKIIREVYEHFLTEDEIQEVIKGAELWFDAEKIASRLQQREEIRAKIASEAVEEETSKEMTEE